eukprot:TRINITY_DN51639_c0_g1_i2.p1 TRINITY_DN51639_c0_g1~~TRINITY_DN51639_c0_g1_i2.p1  ORF type:complete len:581 (-),score=166.67 TRINITY_DN51639_c0_g1_i2:190-1893(-)
MALGASVVAVVVAFFHLAEGAAAGKHSQANPHEAAHRGKEKVNDEPQLPYAMVRRENMAAAKWHKPSRRGRPAELAADKVKADAKQQAVDRLRMIESLQGHRQQLTSISAEGDLQGELPDRVIDALMGDDGQQESLHAPPLVERLEQVPLQVAAEGDHIVAAPSGGAAPLVYARPVIDAVDMRQNVGPLAEEVALDVSERSADAATSKDAASTEDLSPSMRDALGLSAREEAESQLATADIGDGDSHSTGGFEVQADVGADAASLPASAASSSSNPAGGSGQLPGASSIEEEEAQRAFEHNAAVEKDDAASEGRVAGAASHQRSEVQQAAEQMPRRRPVEQEWPKWSGRNEVASAEAVPGGPSAQPQAEQDAQPVVPVLQRSEQSGSFQAAGGSAAGVLKMPSSERKLPQQRGVPQSAAAAAAGGDLRPANNAERDETQEVVPHTEAGAPNAAKQHSGEEVSTAGGQDASVAFAKRPAAASPADSVTAKAQTTKGVHVYLMTMLMLAISFVLAFVAWQSQNKQEITVPVSGIAAAAAAAAGAGGQRAAEEEAVRQQRLRMLDATAPS